MRETIIVAGRTLYAYAGFRHAAQNHLLDADHNSDDRGRFRTVGWAGVAGYKGGTNFFPPALN